MHENYLGSSLKNVASWIPPSEMSGFGVSQGSTFSVRTPGDSDESYPQTTLQESFLWCFNRRNWFQ